MFPLALLPLLASLLSFIPTQAAYDHFDPSDPASGRRLVTSIQYNKTYPIDLDQPLCLRVSGTGYNNIPGQSVNFSKCTTQNQTALGADEQFIVSFPRPTDPDVDVGVWGPVTVRTGTDKAGRACLTANFNGARREEVSGVGLTIEECTDAKRDYQYWNVRNNRVSMMGRVNGRAICLGVDTNSGPDAVASYWRKARAIWCSRASDLPAEGDQSESTLQYGVQL